MNRLSVRQLKERALALWDTLWLILYMLLALSALSAKVAKGQQRPSAKHVAHPINSWGLPLEIDLPVTEYSQPFIYTLWWAQIADCEGFPVPDSAQQATVQFFSVPASLFTLDDQWSVALATTAGWEPSIYVGAPYVWQEETIKHEILHVILHWAGFEFKNFHPAEYFEKCGIHIYGNPHN